MKKLIALMLALVMVTALAACTTGNTTYNYYLHTLAKKIHSRPQSPLDYAPSTSLHFKMENYQSKLQNIFYIYNLTPKNSSFISTSPLKQ